MTVLILPRRGTASDWATVNPILSMGELGFETDTKKTKRGDGTTVWNSLPYEFDGSSGGGGSATWPVTGTPTVVAAGADQSAARAVIAAAGVDGSNKLLAAHIPDLSVIDYIGTPASQAAMLALTGQKGDWCIRSDTGVAWVITGTPTTSIGSWRQMPYPSPTLSSVAALVHGATAKTTPVDADEFLIVDSEASNVGKRLTVGALSAMMSALSDAALQMALTALRQELNLNPVPPASIPKSETIQEDFSLAYDSALAAKAGYDTSLITRPSGTLRIDHGAAVNTDYNRYIYKVSDLTASNFYLEIPDAGNQALAEHEVQLGVVLDGQNKVHIVINNGNWKVNKTVAGAFTDNLGSITYSSTTHRWARIMETAGTIYFQTSVAPTSGVFTWITRYSMANPFSLIGVSLELACGVYGASSASYGVFDNVNVLSSTPTVTGTGVTTTTANLLITPSNAVVSSVGRNGVDASGAGPWSGPVTALPFANLVPDTDYTLYAVIGGVTYNTNIHTLAVVGGGGGGGGSPTAPTGPPGTWTLQFEDTFSGSSLDLVKWGQCWFDPGSGDVCGTMNPTGPSGLPTKKSNVTVSGGYCRLRTANGAGGLITTNPANGAGLTGYQFTTGAVEARIRFPGNGTKLYNWNAFWSSGQPVWPANGENDIAEVLGGDMTVNYHSSGPNSRNWGSVPGYWGDAFHIYTMHRLSNRVDIYYDGVKVKSYPTDEVAPHYLIFISGTSATSPGITGAASEIQIDYVRAWT